jgi:GntR family transcriptional regulator
VRRPAQDEVRRTATQLAVQARDAGLDGETVLAIVRAALLRAAAVPSVQE